MAKKNPKNISESAIEREKRNRYRVSKEFLIESLDSTSIADAVNEAGGLAYKLEPKHALAQFAATGTFGNAFYSTAETQLAEVLKLID